MKQSIVLRPDVRDFHARPNSASYPVASGSSAAGVAARCGRTYPPQRQPNPPLARAVLGGADAHGGHRLLLDPGRGHLSAIHVLSVVTIVNLGYAFWAIRRGKVHGHRISMICSYTALCIAGVFTLQPYRMLGKLVFG